MHNETDNITVLGECGSSLSVIEDRVEIRRKNKIKQIPINQINRFAIIDMGKKNQHFSIYVDGIYIWGEHEISFYFLDNDLENAKEALLLFEYKKCGKDYQSINNQNEQTSYRLFGMKGTSLMIDSESLVMCKKNNDLIIPFDEIKDVCVSNGDSLPHISITKKSNFLKGDCEIDFYYECSYETARDFVASIKHRLFQSSL